MTVYYSAGVSPAHPLFGIEWQDDKEARAACIKAGVPLEGWERIGGKARLIAVQFGTGSWYGAALLKDYKPV